MKVLYKLLNYYELLYIHKQSKHPPSITKQISSMINKKYLIFHVIKNALIKEYLIFHVIKNVSTNA